MTPTDHRPVDLWFEATAFRDHLIRILYDTGLHWRIIAAHADLAPRTLAKLLPGHSGPERIHCTIGRALLRLDADTLNQAENIRVPAAESRRTLQALIALGADQTEHSFTLPRDRILLDAVHQTCTMATAARIRASYDQAIEHLRPTGRMAS